MILHCPGKKCNTTRDHKLKVDTNEAVCMECGVANKSVSEIMKNAMKAANEIYHAVDSRQAFSYKCGSCMVNRAPKIVNEKAVCSVCSTPFNLATPMIEAIKVSLGKTATAVEDTKTELATKEGPGKGVVKRRKE